MTPLFVNIPKYPTFLKPRASTDSVVLCKGAKLWGLALFRQSFSEMRSQEVVARVTADNLVLILRAKSAEARATAAAAERDRLADAAEEQRDPWLSHVTAFDTLTY